MELELPPEPEKPLNSDCCGGGSCCPCVWDVYYEKYREWQDACHKLKESQKAENDSKDS
ncbi:Oxidoreductase-like protein, N-terminal [Marisediminitalea aggregata]|uniref:Oxidoreductase-like protein, N-terminal n=1 Tax=Marisediminitalea aggregata TaxID=634436 RepID=A0A1M5F384_9ALTE|nr:oxidoreductase-like domain-containing protein [Marisediminitalea aggregata]SHF86009.1 Oxidoreductase-like protein, N-terminal [Marisediminitalea aggregata]